MDEIKSEDMNEVLEIHRNINLITDIRRGKEQILELMHNEVP